MRTSFAIGIALCFASLSVVAAAHPLEKGLVVSDPRVMQALEQRGYAFRDFIKPRVANGKECRVSADDGPSTNPFNRSPLCSVAAILAKRVETAQSSTLDSRARADADGDTRFPTDFFSDPKATLTLVGVVNRMDRAFRLTHQGEKSPAESCGEIRFIYRFGYRELWANEVVASRLPLTLNLVLRARRPQQAESCAAIARRWLAFANAQPEEPVDDAAAAQRVAGALKSGPLAILSGEHIDRIEVNMQILRLTASSKQDFGTHAEYLLKVFNWDPVNRIFVEFFLENQIDRDLNVTDRRTNPAAFRKKLSEFKRAVFTDNVLQTLDQGTLVIPQDFVALGAVSVAPGGESRSQNGPLNALIGTQAECTERPQDFLCKAELDRLLNDYKARRGELARIKTTEGLIARFNDSSCTGCHQTRAIAGFHFTGADLMTDNAFAPNTVFVPGSAQFFADLPRRKAILQSIASGNSMDKIDFSRGFSARPDQRFAQALRGTALFDGWGAACHVDAGTLAADRSFSTWGCGNGLRCEPYMQAKGSARGICVNAAVMIGDPLERGVVSSDRFGNDTYTRTEPNQVKAYQSLDTSLNVVEGKQLWERLHLPQRPDAIGYVAAQQQYRKETKTGGFPGGMLRLKCCENLPDGTTCGKVAVDGFNNCLDNKQVPFTQCFRENVNYAGLRACDAANPCREDYICLQSLVGANTVQRDHAQLRPITKEYACGKPDESWLSRARKGACIPPYFVLQFRADKHHVIPGNPPGH